jgi:DNA-binding transcriptional LysR family regulator
VDLAITPWLHDQNGLESLPLTVTRLLTVAAPEFCNDRTLLTMDAMKSLVQVVVRDSGWRDQGLSFGVLEGGRHWVVSDHLTKKQLIVAAMGWGRLQEHLIEKELRDGTLVPLDIGGYPTSVTMEIRAVRRYGEPTGPLAQALWQDLKTLGGRA